MTTLFPVRRYVFVVGSLLALLVSFSSGSVMTIKATGGGDYTSLDDAIEAIQVNDYLDPDTILFIDDAQYTYIWSGYIDRNIGTIMFRSTQTNPDLFPIINHTDQGTYNFFQQNNASFENLIISGTLGYEMGQGARNFSFRNCVFRNNSDQFIIYVQGYNGGSTIFENCLFEGNSATDIFAINFWGGSNTFHVINCTFDDNQSIWSNDVYYSSNFRIANCIFTDNTTTFRGDILRSRTTYSFTDENNISNYGTGCIYRTTSPYTASTRNNPSDWKISLSSDARDLGTTSGAPSTDISGFNRSGNPDAGCWEVQLTDFSWDISSNAGYQSGSGIWGTDNYWSHNGTTLRDWPGAGFCATFQGNDGNYTVTLSAPQSVDSMSFLSETYTITDETLTFTSRNNVHVASGNDAIIASVIDGSIGLEKNGDGTLILTGANTFTGGTIIENGTLQLGNGGTAGRTYGSVANNGTFVISRSNVYTMSNVISGPGDLEQAGNGTTILSGTNTYTGSTTISDGILQIGNGATSGAIPADAVIIVSSPGKLVFNRSDTSVHTGLISGDGEVEMAGSGAKSLRANNTYTGLTTISNGALWVGLNTTEGTISDEVLNNSVLMFNRSDEYIYAGEIRGTGTVLKWGTGKLILTGTNSYTGGTDITVDTLQIGNGGTAGEVIGEISNSNTLVFNRSNNYTSTGIISGTGNIVNMGAGTTVLGDANTYTGVTTILDGAFSVGTLDDGGSPSSIGASPADGDNLIIDGGALIFTGTNQSSNRLFTIGSSGATIDASGSGELTFSGTGTLPTSGTGSRTLTLTGTNTGDNTFSPIIASSVAVTKTGTGTWILEGTNTATGPTTVDEGILYVNGSTSSSSSVTVNSGAIIGGNGTLGAVVSVDGTLSPGFSGPGDMSFNDDLSFSGGGECAVDIAGTSAGSSYDQLTVAGSVDLGSAVFTGTLGYVPTPNDEYMIISNTGSGSITGTFSGMPDNSVFAMTYNGTAYTFSITYSGGDGNDVVLTAQTVATDFTWDISSSSGIQAGNGIWGTDDFWTADGTYLVPWPGAGNTATFSGSDGPYIITINGTQDVDSLMFISSTYTLTGGTIDLRNFSGITVASGENAVIESDIDGSAGIAKYGDGSLVLAADNSFSGTLTINDGTVRLGNAGTSGSVGGNISNSGTLVFDRSDDITFSSIISGSGAVVNNGAGSVVITAAQTYTGATDLISGTLQIGNGGTDGSIASGSDITNNASFIVNRSDSLLYSGIISGSGTITVDGGGVYVLSGNNSFTGTADISDGILQLGNGGTSGTLAGDIDNSGTLRFNRSNTYHYSNDISGSGSVDQNGSDTLILSGANSYTGTTSINSGILQIGNGGNNATINSDIYNSGELIFHRFNLTYSNEISGSGDVTKRGTGYLQLTGSNTWTGQTTVLDGILQIGNGGTDGSIVADITNSGTVQFSHSNTYTYAGGISGSGDVLQDGQGTLIFTGTHTYSGTTTIDGGILQLGNGGTTGAISSSSDIINNTSIVVNRSNSYTYGGNISGIGEVRTIGTGTLVLTGTNTYTGDTRIEDGTLQLGNGGTAGSVSSSSNIINESELIVERSNSYTYNGVISGSGDLTVDGTGTLILSGSNSYSGTTSINSGTLQVGDGGTTGSISTTVANSGNLNVNRSNTFTYGGVISGSGSVENSGSGTLVLTGTNTYTGTTTVSDGTLQIGNGGTTGSISSPVSNDGEIIINRSNAWTYNEMIDGSGSVQISGTGTITLSADHTYTGATNITSGTVVLTGSTDSGSAVTVADGAVIGGSGNFAGSVTADGIVEPGTRGTAVELSTGELTLSSTSVFNCDIGTSNDVIAVSGDLTLDGTLNINEITGYGEGTYDIITFTGDLTDNTLEFGYVPDGTDYELVIGAHVISITLTTGLITSEPSDTAVLAGEAASFDVTAAGTGALTYAWFQEPAVNTGETSNTLSFANVATADTGRYRCIVTDGGTGESDTSRWARLSIIYSPSITEQPRDTQRVFVGDTSTFTLTASGTSPIIYRWYRTVDGGDDSLYDSSTSTTYIIDSTAFEDSGSYYCVLSNIGGNITSDAMILIVNHVPPAITEQPENISERVGSSIRFSLTATGNPAPAFAWYKVGNNTVEGTTSSLSKPDITFPDSGRYYCIVSNPGGTVSSDTVRLTVNHIPPEITLQPEAQTVDELDSARFVTSATGNAPPHFHWYKVGSDDEIGSDSVLVIPSVSIDDEGDYFCVAENPGGTDISDTVSLSVHFLPPVADFTFSPASGGAPFTVSFNDSSTGSVTSYFWEFGDDSAADSANPVHVYEEAGLYTVSLAIEGPGGVDTVVKSEIVFVYEEGQNPIRMSAQFIQDGDVKITLANIGLIDTVLPTPRCDSIGIWVRSDTLPESLDDCWLYTSYPRSSFTGDTIIDDLILPDIDSLYGLMSGVFWDDGSISDFLPANGCMVLLRDTVPPTNPLSISGTYKNDDTVTVRLSDMTTLDRELVDSIIIWYGRDSISAGSSDSSTERFAMRSIANEATFSTYLTDSIFTALSETLYVAVFLKGYNGLASPPVYDAFVTASPYAGKVTLTVSAEAVTATRIRVNWAVTDEDDDLTSLRAWYGTTAIETGETELNTSIFTEVHIDEEDTSLILSDLEPNTEYFIAVQASVEDDFWLPISEEATTSCQTPEIGGTSDFINTVIIDTVYYDSLESSIHIGWCIDTSQLDEHIDVGITYSVTGYPEDPTGNQSISISRECTDTIVRLRTPLLFDTTYFIALWSRQGSNVWTDPTDESRTTVHIGAPFRQDIVFFDTSRTEDTISAFNETVLIWKDSTYIEKGITRDTLQVFKPDALPDGFIIVGVPFYFRKADPVLPLQIGFHLENLPEDFTIRDVRIYSEQDGNGAVTVYHNCIIDAENDIVYITTSDLQRPFLAMIDTIPPEISILSDTAAIISSTKTLRDTVSVSDNVSNVQWRYLFNKGSDELKVRDDDMLDETEDTFTLTVSESMQAISSESGLRAWLIVSDGAHTDTVNLSRQVQRSESDRITTEGGIWTPIYATAQLDNDSVGSFMKRISVNDSSEYDKRHVRLYKWYRTSGNKDKNTKWIEYDPKSEWNQKIFALHPGNLLWIKTRKNRTTHFNKAATLSLKDTFAIKLKSETWTDLGIPYRFDIPLKAILSATGNNADSLFFFSWEQDGKSKRYSAEPLYVTIIPDKSESDTTLGYSSKGGYTVYNSSSKDITVKIPPVPTALYSPPSTSTAKKHKKTSGWTVRFDAATKEGIKLSPVYCGYAPGVAKSIIPTAPTFGEVRTVILDRETGFMYGHHIGEDGSDGVAREILLTNDSKAVQTVRYSIASSGLFPEGFKAFCYNPETGKCDTNTSVTIGKESSASVWVVAGNQEFRNRFMTKLVSLEYMLHNIYPNPARSLVMMKFTVPLGAKERIRVAIYNVLGKRIWEKEVKGYLKEGVHTITWHGKNSNQTTVASGMYLIRFMVISENGKTMKQYDRRITYFR